MSILDIALQRFSLERDNDREPRRYCQEMQQYENLRTKADEDPELKAAFISSLKSVFSLVESPFESMLLKKNGVICSKAWDDNRIDASSFFVHWRKLMKIFKWRS